MAKSPLLIGSDVRSINASSLAILKNKDLIACEPPTRRPSSWGSLFNGEACYVRSASSGLNAAALAILNEFNCGLPFANIT